MLLKKKKRCLRHKRVRSRIEGTTIAPRFSVFRSNKHIWCQLIDDQKGQTLVAASDKELIGDRRQPASPRRRVEAGATGGKEQVRQKNKSPVASRQSKVIIALEVGKLIAKKAQEKGIQKVVFDRGGYKYHGRVKAVAEGAREEGLKF